MKPMKLTVAIAAVGMLFAAVPVNGVANAATASSKSQAYTNKTAPKYVISNKGVKIYKNANRTQAINQISANTADKVTAVKLGKGGHWMFKLQGLGYAVATKANFSGLKNVKPAKYIYNAASTGYVQAKKAVQYTDNGQAKTIAKGTTLAADELDYATNGVVTINNTVPLLKRNFKIVTVRPFVNMDLLYGKGGMLAGKPTAKLNFTLNGTIQNYKLKTGTNKFALKQTVKINTYKTKGKTTYVYYKTKLAGIKDQKVNKTTYRLAVKTLKDSRYYSAKNKGTALMHNFMLGGKAYYHEYAYVSGK